jgi:hypothetical protein
MTFRFTISLALTLMLSYYGSSDAYAQRARPSAQADVEGQTDSPPAVGRGGRGGAAMGQAGARSGPGGARGGHGGGHGGGNTNPLFAALDQDQDGQLSPAELRAAAAVMKTLDKDGDGQLSLTECAPAGGGGHGHGGGHGRVAADPQAEAAAMVKTLMEFDLNGHGALTKDVLLSRTSHSHRFTFHRGSG